MRKANIASVGLGAVAQRWHLPTIAELTKKGDLNFIAVCDIDEAKASETGKQYGLPHYTDVEEMLEKHKDIDVVDVCAGDYEHHTVAKIAAEHKMHPIVEKPMAPTLAFCDVIINACKKNGVHFEVAENYFRMPNDRILIKLITEGVLGDIMRVHFIEPSGRGRQFVHGAKPQGIARPVSTFGSHSGVCIDMGVHRMSQLRFYAQSEPKRIAGITKQFVPNTERVYEDWGHALIEFESGAVGVYEASQVGEGNDPVQSGYGNKRGNDERQLLDFRFPTPCDGGRRDDGYPDREGTPYRRWGRCPVKDSRPHRSADCLRESVQGICDRRLERRDR